MWKNKQKNLGFLPPPPPHFSSNFKHLGHIKGGPPYRLKCHIKHILTRILSIDRGKEQKSSLGPRRQEIQTGGSCYSFVNKKADLSGTRAELNRGFSLVGALTASVIGLMVTYGITHNLVQTKLYSLSMEKREQRKSLYSFVNNILQEPQACRNSLKGQDLSGSSADTDRSFELTALKDVSDDTLMDFTKDGNGNLTDSATKNQLKNLGVDKFEKLEFRYKPARSSMGQVVLTSRTEVKGLHEKSNREIVWEISALKVEAVSGHGDQVTSCYSQISLFVSEEGDPNDPMAGPGGNVFAGHGAGVSNQTAYHRGEGNTFIGYRAGWKNTTGRDNVFIGALAGMNNTTGSRNMFIGEVAGYSNTTGSKNMFAGMESGKNITTGGENTFIGEQSGISTTTGRNNVFLGQSAGRDNTSGEENVFVGRGAGYNNESGEYNTYLGNWAGDYNTTGEHNTCVGFRACDRNTGSRNVIIGYQADTNARATDDAFIVGNGASTRWLTGTIGGSSLKVKGQETVNASSRTLKKSISRFFEFEKSLQDILNTPLFNYSYKEKALHPKKQRMGLIAEELPKHLQLPGENYPHPDWPSIYGTLWAGIKALNLKVQRLKKVFDNLKTEMEEKLSSLSSDNKNSLKKLESQNKALALQIKEMREHFKDSLSKQKQEIKNQQDQISALSSQLEKLKQESTN